MNTNDRTEDSRTTQERGSGFTAALWLAGCLIAGTIGYQYGYQTRDAEKAKTGYILSPEKRKPNNRSNIRDVGNPIAS